jgi:uncharacterized membrane protein
MMEEHCRAGHIKAGSIAGIDAVGGLLARHFPAAIPNQAPARNELPDQPTLL